MTTIWNTQLLIKGLIFVILLFCNFAFLQPTNGSRISHFTTKMDPPVSVRRLLYGSAKRLDVTIREANPKMPDTFTPVASGEAQFGVAHSGILQQRVNGQPFVAMAAILQFSPYCWMVKDSSDIFHPRDFTAKRITEVSKKDSTELLVMLKRSGIDIATLEVYEGDEPALQAWQENKLDAMQVYVTTQPYFMTQQGVSHRLICPQRYGMDVYGDVLFTSESMLKKHPQTVEKFYQASLKGWRYAMMNMDEAIAITQQVYAPNKSFHQLAYEAEVVTHQKQRMFHVLKSRARLYQS